MKIAVFCTAFTVLAITITNAQDARVTKFTSENLLNGAQSMANGSAIECYYEACPPGWAKSNWSKCFLVRPTPARRDDAERDCATLNSDLAIVTSDSDRYFLNSLAMKTLPINTGLWLGAIRKGQYWFTSDLINFVYSAWVPGHPDFTIGNCVSLFSDASQLESTFWGRLASEDCQKQLHYACQLSQYNYDRFVCQPREK